MNNNIKLSQVVKRHEENDIDYRIINLSDQSSILLSAYGGRVFGPFLKNDVSITWIHEAFADKDMFAKALNNHYFHVGGERIWIGPELDFFCDAPELFNETYTIQKELDPGNFYLSNTKNSGVKMEQDVEVKKLSDNSLKSFYFSRILNRAQNPLKYMHQLRNINANYFGFSQDIYLRDTSTEKKMYLEPWILMQINPGGRIIVPYFGEHEFDNYYDPVDESVFNVTESYAEWFATGNRKYKVAYKSANTFGRMGYVNSLDGDDYYLMVRNYYNDPSIPYCSEPWRELGKRGTSMYFYNDDGSNGGFTEFENSCQTIGLDTAKDESYSSTSLWFFTGGKNEIQKIIKVLLGVDYEIRI